MDHTEFHEVKGRRQHEINKTLNWWDLMKFEIGAINGAAFVCYSFCLLLKLQTKKQLSGHYIQYMLKISESLQKTVEGESGEGEFG